MPELPEVHAFKQYFDAAAIGCTIAGVDIFDDYIIKQVGDQVGNTRAANREAGKLGRLFSEAVSGHTITASYRQGKYLFAELSNGHDILLHFGMTGDLNLYTEPEARSKHERFAFVLHDGQRLGFDDPRKFAKIRYLIDRSAYLSDIGLGTDALLISAKEFLAKAEGRKTTIKAFLLNQAVLAGVGNLYADEVLYQTRIHPESKVAALTPKQLRQILRKTQEVLQIACERGAYYKEYPEGWFWQWRKQEKVARRGTVERGEVGGRTTYWVDPWQRLYSDP